MSADKKGVLLVISGPSATGKGTICAKLRERLPIQYSISATTRAPRSNETDGKDYFFLSKEAFEEKIAQNGFLEWAQVYDKYYGTPKDFVLQTLERGQDCILEIDVQGALKVKAAYPEAVMIFVLPPTLAELRMRLVNRQTETQSQIEERMRWVIKELKEIKKYEYLVINDDLETAIGEIVEILHSEHLKVTRNLSIESEFIAEYERSFGNGTAND